jgi:hypothetical protein
MGRSRSYRERIKFETHSVESKSLKSLLCQELQSDFGLSKLESDVLSIRSLVWLQEMVKGPLPGQLYFSVPATPVKQYAYCKRTEVKLTVVDINSDGELWREFGLCVMQRSRALRLIYETWRQGGWISYSELSSFLNLTPNALSNRLRVLKEYGVWLPHVGNKGAGSGDIQDSQNFFHSVLLKRFLDGESSEKLREVFGLTVGGFELMLRNAVTVWEYLRGIKVDCLSEVSEVSGVGMGMRIGQISKVVGLKPEEVNSIFTVISEYHKKKCWKNLYESYKSYRNRQSAGAWVAFDSCEVDKVDKGVAVVENGENKEFTKKDSELSDRDILDILEKEHGMALIIGRIYLRRLRELAARLSSENSDSDSDSDSSGGIEGSRKMGETIFFAISSDEGPRTRLSEGKIVPVCLKYFSMDEYQLGPRGCHKNRVSDLKFARILRYTTQAREQGGLLSIPDLAMLMGIGIDAVRRLIKANGKIIVPTRGLIKDMGRSVSHKCKIVELYLQMYTETEIVERTGHCYESIEAYLKEFVRVMTLADQGLNAVMIRRVTGRSMLLVKSYLDLYEKYDGDPDYVFRIEHLRNVFAKVRDAREEKENKNKVGGKREKAEDELKKNSYLPLSLSLHERKTDE